MNNTQNAVTTKVVISINELAKAINISHNAVRNWVIKPIPNQPYDPNQINYVEVRKHLHAYFADEREFISLVGCAIDDLEISYKANGSINAKKRNRAKLSELIEGEEYILHNYHMEKVVKFAGCMFAGCTNENIYVFSYKDGYLAYDAKQFERDTLYVEAC